MAAGMAPTQNRPATCRSSCPRLKTTRDRLPQTWATVRTGPASRAPIAHTRTGSRITAPPNPVTPEMVPGHECDGGNGQGNERVSGIATQCNRCSGRPWIPSIQVARRRPARGSPPTVARAGGRASSARAAVAPRRAQVVPAPRCGPDSGRRCPDIGTSGARSAGTPHARWMTSCKKKRPGRSAGAPRC